MAERYCSPDELLIGSMVVDAEEKIRYVNLAADDMDAELGFVYTIPIAPDVEGGTIPTHVAAMLAKINRLMASGRFVLARNGSQDDSLHAYGKSLLREGRDLLDSIISGSIQLIGLEKSGVTADLEGGNAPTAYVGDVESGVDAFYAWMGRTIHDVPPTPDNPWWKPGVS